MKINTRGQILPMVMITLVVLTLIISGLITWMQNDSKWAVKEQKSTSAISFAEAGIDRGTWKLQSTTATWNTAALGTAIPNYNFDTTFKDIPGGTYRIKFTAGVYNTKPSVTVTAEGRDNSTNEVRAISAVFINQTIYSPIMAGGSVTWGKGLGVFWGPIMSQGDIQLQDDVVGAWYYPRKYAKGVVTGPPSGNYPRDTNGLTPPNTDNVEWWSEYTAVPNVPIMDFAALRSSAATTGTLNIYGCKNSTFHGATGAIADQGGTAGNAPWDLRASCTPNAAGDVTPHNQHFGDSSNYVNTYLNANQNYVWYWDHDVALEGAFCNGGANPCSPGQATGLRGTVVVRGNLMIDTPGDLIYSGHVPTNAWQEESKLTKTTFDTAASNEYPADIGLHQSTGTFGFGYTYPHFCIPLASCGEYATVGIKGFTYVGGNLTIVWFMDFNGAVWINGSVAASAGSNTQFCGIFYDDTLTVPALNVILLRESWQDAAASNTAWAP